MEPLRRGAIEELKRNLNRGFLSSHSFLLECNLQDGTAVKLTYADRPEFSFKLLHPQSQANSTGNWRTQESPGRHFLALETYDHPRFDQAWGAVYGWVDRLVEEIVLEAKASSGSTLLDELRRNVSDTADSLPEPDKPFTEEELEDWSQQLMRLLARMQELEQANEIQRGRVDQLTRELEQLKKQGTTVPKRTWLKTAGNKVLDLLDTTSKSALKALAEGAVKALLEHKP
jgi:hypothetical protein